MNNLNKEFFDKVLSKKFPGEYRLNKVGLDLYEQEGGKYYYPVRKLDDAFYFAEKLGLFRYSQYKELTGKWCLTGFNGEYEVEFFGYNQDIEQLTSTAHFFVGKTPQEAIVKALITIYGSER